MKMRHEIDEFFLLPKVDRPKVTTKKKVVATAAVVGILAAGVITTSASAKTTDQGLKMRHDAYVI